MTQKHTLSILIVINKDSGTAEESGYMQIKKLCDNSEAVNADFFDLDFNLKNGGLSKKVFTKNLDVVVAVGGDGTIGLVAEHLLNTDIKLGIIPTGSANGLAKNLGIPINIVDAFKVILAQHTVSVTRLSVNGRYCLHLADIGFNATLIKRFEVQGRRGMWGYVKAGYRVLLNMSELKVTIEIEGKLHQRRAVMVVIANANRYGTGVHINPIGSLKDDLFEIVVIKKVSLIEIAKMMFTNWNPNPSKTEIFQCKKAVLSSKRAAHFQVDGEYFGKTKSVTAEICAERLAIICPESSSGNL